MTAMITPLKENVVKQVSFMQKLFIFPLLFFCTAIPLKAAALSDCQPDFKITTHHLNFVTINRGLGSALIPGAEELNSLRCNVKNSVDRATKYLIAAIGSNHTDNAIDALNRGADPEALVLRHDTTKNEHVYIPLVATTSLEPILKALTKAKIEAKKKALESLEFYTPNPDCCECEKKEKATAMHAYLTSLIAQSQG